MADHWTTDDGLAWVDHNDRRWTLDPEDIAHQLWTGAPDQTVTAALTALTETVRADTALRSELIAALTDRIVVLEQDNEGLSRHTAFMERYRMRATRLEAAAEALLDALPTVWQGSSEGQALRRLLDDPPGREDG